MPIQATVDPSLTAYVRKARRERARSRRIPGGVQRAIHQLAQQRDQQKSQNAGNIAAAAYPGSTAVSHPPVRRSYFGKAETAFGLPAQDRTSPIQFLHQNAVLRSPAADRFADIVARSLGADSLLTWSSRQNLVRQAFHLGIERFEASLIIAACQHRAEKLGRAAEKSAGRRKLTSWALFTAMQSIIVAVAWMIWNI